MGDRVGAGGQRGAGGADGCRVAHLADALALDALGLLARPRGRAARPRRRAGRRRSGRRSPASTTATMAAKSSGRRDRPRSTCATRSAPHASQRRPPPRWVAPHAGQRRSRGAEDAGHVVALGGAGALPRVVVARLGDRRVMRIVRHVCRKHICLCAQMDRHDVNVVGALAVALGDRMRDATEDGGRHARRAPGGTRLPARVGGRAHGRHAGRRAAAEPLPHRAGDRPPGGRRAGGARARSGGRARRARAAHARWRARPARRCSRRARPRCARRSTASRPRRSRPSPGPPSTCSPGSPTGAAPPVRTAGCARATPAAITTAAARSPGPRTPRKLRWRRPLVRGRQDSFAVVVPDERLQIMSEEACGRHVVDRAERGYGTVLLGPLYADVEMAHVSHRTRGSEPDVPVPAGIQVHQRIRPPARSPGPRRAAGGRTRSRARAGRSGIARWPLTTMSAISP